MSLTRMLCFAGSLVLLEALARAADVTSTWNGSSGQWSDTLNWDTTHFPNNGNGGLTYDAVVNGGAVDIPGSLDVVIESLTFSGGQIGGEGRLQLNAASTWSGGTLAGTGAGLTLAGSGPLTVVAGGFPYCFFDGVVTNQGTLHWLGRYIAPNGGSDDTFVNAGIIELAGSGSSFTPHFGPGSLENQAGGVIRNVGGGSTSIELLIDNQGTIDVQAGSLQLSGGSSSGAFHIADGAGLYLSGDFTLEDGAVSTGAGTIYVNVGRCIPPAWPTCITCN